MIYLLKDKYGNEIATEKKELAKEILDSNVNPFDIIEEMESYDGLIVNTLNQFCKAFY